MSPPGGTVIATVGPAGAGKTTWRRAHTPRGVVVVSLDELRSRLSPCGCSGDPSVNAAAVRLGESITSQVLRFGGTVVWDVTSYLPRFRARLLALADHHQARTEAVLILPPLLQVLAQNRHRDDRRCGICGTARQVPETVVWQMHTAITAALPGLHREGWQHLHYLALPDYVRTAHRRRTAR
ncbi:AAA family ATPase [Amycolatopsis magusensis]|uniref:AAA family ATPase n=1 Tax=Amycolatopsis magusensis TaxID=882444 RepID=UPI0024A9DEE6|nr:ATP-binding protein [Amycolatopsis magusensis]MDI5980103.1 ATP-binding protein [Amycolatopsis magusensis]